MYVNIRAAVMIRGHAPRHLQRTLLKLEPALAGAPEAGAVDVVSVGFARFRFWNGGAALLATQGREGAVGVEDGQVAFKLVDEIELHLRELRVVGRKGFHAILVGCRHMSYVGAGENERTVPKRMRASETTFLMWTGDSSAFAAT